MRYFTACFLLFSLVARSQHTCSRASVLMARSSQPAAAAAVHESEYDMKFVHLDLAMERTNKSVSGHVKMVATVTTAVMDTFVTVLHQNHTVDSIRFNGALVGFLRNDSLVKALVPQLAAGASFTGVISHHGTAPNGGAAIGGGLNNASSPSWGNQVTWSLSEAFVAYHWWPCKQMLTDKIDSSWVSVTTDSTNKVGSNGILRNVVTIGNKKRYEWRSRYPIDYYLISVAIARYREYNLYAKPQYLNGDSIWIQNYIYDNALNSTNFNGQKGVLNTMPKVLEFLSDMYGMYPFHREKYGHCMAPLSGGMEHQTMSTVGFFDYYINAHELGHQWWGDHVTCKSWKDIWINEGFASYTEHLVAEYLDPQNFQLNLSSAHGNVMTQAGGSIHFTGNDTMRTNRIFSSRLTYDKGGAIVHTLRFVTNNDSMWFNVLRGFQSAYANGVAGTDDFKRYYDQVTGTNSTQFFNQWYYGEGYPTFDVRFNNVNGKCVIKVVQSTSVPSVTPLFVTPVEYRLSRTGKSDTTVRVMHAQATEIYTLQANGTVNGISCDPNNWLINLQSGLFLDPALGVDPATGMTMVHGRKLDVVPNPGRGIFNVRAQGVSGTLMLSDATGKMVLSSPFSGEARLDLTAMPGGIYVLQVKAIDGSAMQAKLVSTP